MARSDGPGYGGSEKRSGQDVPIAAQARLFAELLDHWQLDEPAVIGHDFGGAAELRAHLHHSVPYASLALVDAVALSPWGSPFFRLMYESSEVFELLPVPMPRALVSAYISSATP